MLRPFEATRPSRPALTVPRWAIAALVALVFVAFGCGFLTSQAVRTEPSGLAPEWVVSLVENNSAALNAHNAADLEATFADDAVLTDMQTGRQAFGAAQIVSYIMRFEDMAVERTSDVIYMDGYATCTFRYAGETSSVSTVVAFKIEDGKIAHEWVMTDEPGGYGI